MEEVQRVNHGESETKCPHHLYVICDYSFRNRFPSSSLHTSETLPLLLTIIDPEAAEDNGWDLTNGHKVRTPAG